MKKINKDNGVLLSLIEKLMKSKKPVWKRVAKELARPRRSKVEVNLSKIEQFAPEDSTIIVPGKVLGAGMLSKKLTIAAFSFSSSAKQLISKAGGKAISIDGLHKSNPDGRNTILMR
ncbi:50S ribosomal protein L18e [Candidatus Micrarchaeota archaeon]|nr:50S ribosomal protein L18e [Candidatus Micrarchaeota archaeon]MBU1166206.1 50S ribosomal protein L18e [Candidatus Micrarchaeota archaeon]MBU1886948.1 50S ribosomal protein L18e [Candidatus Micrarchaeota archaeon]